MSGAEPPGARPVTYCFPPKNRTVLGDTLIVLVGKGHRQEEGALLCIVSHVILMDWKRNGFRTVTMRLALRSPAVWTRQVGRSPSHGIGAQSRQTRRGTGPITLGESCTRSPLAGDWFREEHVTPSLANETGGEGCQGVSGKASSLLEMSSSDLWTVVSRGDAWARGSRCGPLKRIGPDDITGCTGPGVCPPSGLRGMSLTV